jgi:hypothetical protein
MEEDEEKFSLEFDSGLASPKSLPTFINKNQCSQSTGIPAKVLDEARDLGCPAFNTAGRINLAQFLQWYFNEREKANTKNVDLDTELLSVKLKREQIKLEKDKERLVERDSVAFLIMEIVSTFFGMLEKGLVWQLPPLLSGKGSEEIAATMEDFIKESREGISKILTAKKAGIEIELQSQNETKTKDEENEDSENE